MALVADSPGPVSAHVRARLEGRLNERRVVVWYDGHGAFAALDRPGTVVVSAVGSALRARRQGSSAA
jgi:hypothetical protein